MRCRRRKRSGFVLILVLALLVLLLASWGVSVRQTGILLRLESARAAQIDSTDPVAIALARGIALLETGTPEGQPGWVAQTSTYACTTTVDSISGSQSFNVSFKRQASGNWLVQALPGTSGNVMPGSFAP